MSHCYQSNLGIVILPMPAVGQSEGPVEEVGASGKVKLSTQKPIQINPDTSKIITPTINRVETSKKNPNSILQILKRALKL